MHRIGLQCPLYLNSNAGHLLPFSEALQAPIRIFSSGPTNSIRGAAFLAQSAIEQTGSIVVDIGGTTSDVGYLLKNGYPRLSKSYTVLAGVKANLEMPSVESIGLGGGSILHVHEGDNVAVTVGPDSVGHELTTKALCFGGSTATATDVAVAQGADVGTVKVSLPADIVAKAQGQIKKMLESVIDKTKLSPDPCTVILVGGGAILCPPDLSGASKVIMPEHAGVANAIGAAIAKIHGAAEKIIFGSDIQGGIAEVKSQAVANAIAKGGDGSEVTILLEEVAGVPYTEGQTSIKVEVALPADHARVYSEMLNTTASEEVLEHELHEETKKHDIHDGAADDESTNLSTYKPTINPSGEWVLSETDLKFLEIGCYILGCGGGGSPYAPYLHMRQLLLEGESIKIMRIEDLKDDEMMPPVASVGTPAVSIERPGGDGVWHAMQAMEKEINVQFHRLVATEIGGANGVGTLVWGSSRYYDIPTVDGDMMGKD